MSLKSVVAFLLCVAPATVAAQSVVPVPAANAVRAPNTPMVDTVDRVVAVVGSSVITWSDLAAAVNEQRAAGLKLPDDPAGQLAVARGVLNDLVDQEILVQKAKDVKVDVTDAEVTPQVDRQIKEVRSHFASDIEYRNELKNAGFGSPEEYRRTLFDQFRRRLIQQKTFAELQKSAKPASVTEEEVTAAFDKVKDQLKKRPAMVAFRQIVIAPHASKFADSVALAKAESLLVQLKKGANFEEMAKRESMDPGTKNVGGDLGWNRRGSDLVPQFEAVMFSLRPGELSPIVKTSFGYHIIRVDRVQPAEVKARHILIAPVIDSNDVHLAYLRADSVANMWRKGANFDSLVAKYHDPAEEKGILQPFPIDSLPASYKAAIADLKVNDVSAPFALVSQNGSTKYALVQIVARTAEGEYSLPEMRENIRKQLSEEKQARALLDQLRKQTYVSLRL
ncbi:MAG TPA: peptidylprolyl isomerase [Gemmatimonadaceae bacterium]|jgi:peptidyl-prolyl cis-trans isomerase SurA|nr:peptidylprolyl isomerase [Gemmatimonadaceae bacterium]